MLDLKEFLFLSMHNSLRRRISEVEGEVAEQGNYKRLKIDKNPERYVRKLFEKYKVRIMDRVERIIPTKPDAATKIAKWWRFYKSLNDKIVNNTEQPGKAGYLRKEGGNVLCPITQDGVEYKHAFKIIIDNGSIVVYTIEDFVNYLLSTGNFHCCLTRQELYLPTIRRLVSKARKMSIAGADELIGVYLRREAIRRNRIEHDNRILAIEASCASVMTDIMDSAANHDIGPIEASLRIAEFVPEWRNLINDYMRLDLNSCLNMLEADKERLSRLLNTAHADPFLMLEYVLDEVVQPKLDSCHRHVRLNRRFEEAFPPADPSTHLFSRLPVMSRSPSFLSNVNSPRPVMTGPFGSVLRQPSNNLYSAVAESIINASIGASVFAVPSIGGRSGSHGSNISDLTLSSISEDGAPPAPRLLSTRTVPRTPSPRLSNNYRPDRFGDY